MKMILALLLLCGVAVAQVGPTLFKRGLTVSDTGTTLTVDFGPGTATARGGRSACISNDGSNGVVYSFLSTIPTYSASDDAPLLGGETYCTPDLGEQTLRIRYVSLITNTGLSSAVRVVVWP